MRICPSRTGAAIRNSRTRGGHIGTTCASMILSFAFAFALSGSARAQNDVVMPPAEPVASDNGAPPMTSSGDVSFFSQDLGTLLRLRYNTESYGQDGQGNFDIGSMQVVTMDDAAAFLDAQVTMNDSDGLGYNIGVGYRFLDYPSYAGDSGRVEGVSVWADGMHTEAGNFYPQVGVSFESLGDLWDLRSNFYIPVGKEQQVGNFKSTGQTGFFGNSIAQLTQAVVDSSFTVGELEIARRLGEERDAWVFAGPYFFDERPRRQRGLSHRSPRLRVPRLAAAVCRQ